MFNLLAVSFGVRNAWTQFVAKSYNNWFSLLLAPVFSAKKNQFVIIKFKLCLNVMKPVNRLNSEIHCWCCFEPNVVNCANLKHHHRCCCCCCRRRSQISHHWTAKKSVSRCISNKPQISIDVAFQTDWHDN